MKKDLLLLYTFYLLLFSCSKKNDRPTDLSEMTFVKGGTFQMGSDNGKSYERPVHKVTVGDFYMGKYEVTYETFDAYCKATGKSLLRDLGNGRGSRPVVFISWNQAVEFCNWESEQHNLQPVYTIINRKVSANWKANGFRLPTEAEWEFAARDRGKNEQWAGTSSESQLSSYGNFCDRKCPHDWARFRYTDGYEKTAPVGSFKPNGLGLYDMSGNVAEFCWDWYGWHYYSESNNQTNPTGPIRGENSARMVRGGSWYSMVADTRCTSRNGQSTSIGTDLAGFRLVRTPR